ncbi:flagellar biosynthesis anti-sigma factor FlgM [Tepidiforma sp.]|uniref:flagellar biosynthesis anti-sigma factor FlgM n=1 Tax=Tepidiforma sp. TaxID=2682230 RepID=UPI002ADE4E18|nr:flagellar biosynthesis anti-sigma factor FlgM [Tepidiforma sp.]
MARIDGLTPGGTHLNPAGGPGSAAPAGQAGPADASGSASGPRDVIALSHRGRIVAEAARAVHQARDVRAEKVAALKAAIANGTYSSNAREIAARLLANGIAGDLP